MSIFRWFWWAGRANRNSEGIYRFPSRSFGLSDRCMRVSVYVHLSMCLSLSVCLSVCFSICLSVFFSICLSVCLSPLSFSAFKEKRHYPDLDRNSNSSMGWTHSPRLSSAILFASDGRNGLSPNLFPTERHDNHRSADYSENPPPPPPPPPP